MTPFRKTIVSMTRELQTINEQREILAMAATRIKENIAELEAIELAYLNSQEPK